MTTRLVQNFRGVRATILHAADRNRSVLIDMLEKLGLSVLAIDPANEDATHACDQADLIIVDMDMAETLQLPSGVELSPVPLVVIVGIETPSRLQRAFDLGPTAVLHKPIRSSGIYSTLFFAINEHRRQTETLERMRALEGRRGARRFVHKALLQLMREHAIDDEHAYAMLRKESMRQRTTVEELAVRIVAAGDSKRVARKA